MAEAFGKGGREFLAGMDLGDADRRTLPRRLDEERQAEFAFERGERRGGTFMDRYRARHRQARSPQQTLGDILVEGRGRTEDAAAGKRHARHLGHTLHRPIFAMRAVEHGKQDVDPSKFMRRAMG